jgi:hypothetical protein
MGFSSVVHGRELRDAAKRTLHLPRASVSSTADIMSDTQFAVKFAVAIAGEVSRGCLWKTVVHVKEVAHISNIAPLAVVSTSAYRASANLLSK